MAAKATCSQIKELHRPAVFNENMGLMGGSHTRGLITLVFVYDFEWVQSRYLADSQKREEEQE